MKQELNGERIDYSKIDDLSVDDYRRIFVLVTHEKDRTFEDVFHRMFMACFLLYCIKLGGFFEGDETEDKYVLKYTFYSYYYYFNNLFLMTTCSFHIL